MQTNRNDYIGEPKRRDVLKGKAPLSTFTLTQFKDGGCIFSMAISHVLTDAAGFHSLAARLGDIYTALASKTDLTDANIITHLAAFQFGTDKTKAQTLQTLKHAGSGKPIPLKGILGLLVKNMIIKTMDQSRNNPPVIIHLTADDLARLKETVLKESGEDWMSTNTALCAHFARIMSQLSHGGNLQTSVQLAQLLDLRGRYFDDPAAEQDQFIGNAILIHIIKQSLPLGLQETPRGELASLFKNWTNTIDTEDVKTRLDMLSDCLRHGYSNPRLDVKVPMIAMNNQSKMAAYNVSFHGQAPVRIRPQDVGDNIMFFPTPMGGVEVYIRDIVNHNNQRKLLTPEWQSRLFDF